MASIIPPPVQLRATKKELIAVVTATLSALNEKVNTVDFLGVTQDIITALDKKADQTDFISVTSATIDALDKKVDITDFLIVSNNVLASLDEKVNTVDFLGVTQDIINSIKNITLTGDSIDSNNIRQIGLNTASIKFNAPATGVSLFLTGSSTAAALIASGSYTTGIDLSSATLSNFGIKLPNNAPISWLNSTATGSLKALYVDTTNRLVLGSGIITRVNVSTNQNLDIRGPVSLGSGISLTSQNDTASALLPMEILGSSFKFNGGVILASNGITLPNGIGLATQTAAGSTAPAILMDSSNRLLIGPGSATRIKPGTDTNIDIRGTINNVNGASITAQNDAANATTNLEILSSYLYLNAPITRIAGNLRKSAGVVAAAGTTQATATSLVNDISSVNSGTGGVILLGQVGQKQEIFNRSGAAINIYPPTGASIESAGTNAAVSLANGGHATFIALTATQIYQTV